MAAVGSTYVTLLDMAKRQNPDGTTADLANLLQQQNEMLLDMLWKEGNSQTGERITQVTGLPAAYWRLLNKGTPSSKARTAQVDEQCGMLVARSQLDVDMAGLNGNSAEFRMQEAELHIEGMNQEMASTMIYGTALNPEEFVGLAARYSSLSAGNAKNIIDAGGTGSDNTSIWLVGWGPGVYGIFPKGTMAGLQHENMGVGDAFDADNNRFRAYMDEFKWKAGIALKDWRYVIRIANIDVSNLIADGAGSSVKLMEYMLKALHRLPSMTNCRPVFYANRTVKEMLDIQASNKSNLLLSVGEEEGRLKTMLRGVPIRTMDAILETEARVV